LRGDVSKEESFREKWRRTSNLTMSNKKRKKFFERKGEMFQGKKPPKEGQNN